jgi:hypothetical protein
MRKNVTNITVFRLHTMQYEAALVETKGMTGMTDWADLTRFAWLAPARQRVEDVVASYEQALHDPTRAVAPEGLHMLLIAPPGLGRFRFADALGSLLFNRGHMRDNRINVTFAKDLVSEWIGQTRRATLEKCESGLNAMLLIQYASGLADHTFSQEAVDTLIEFMDATKRRIVIAMILEPSEVPKFVTLYPELVSRFHKIEFPIPGLNEQFDVLRQLAREKNYLLPDDLEELLGPWIERRMVENSWEYMRQIGRVLDGATYAWAERTGAPRGPDRRYQIPEALKLERVDFESAKVEFDGMGAHPTA